MREAAIPPLLGKGEELCAPGLKVATDLHGHQSTGSVNETTRVWPLLANARRYPDDDPQSPGSEAAPRRSSSCTAKARIAASSPSRGWRSRGGGPKRKGLMQSPDLD